MISFNLRCAKDHEFEGWFKDSASFEGQRDAKTIDCPVCGNRKIEKALSRPNISSTKMQASAQVETAMKMRDALRAMRKEVETSHEDVGDNFAEEARKMHYGEVETRKVYGQTSGEEAVDLIEEGVPIAPLPWIEEVNDN